MAPTGLTDDILNGGMVFVFAPPTLQASAKNTMLTINNRDAFADILIVPSPFPPITPALGDTGSAALSKENYNRGGDNFPIFQYAANFIYSAI